MSFGATTPDASTVSLPRGQDRFFSLVESGLGAALPGGFTLAMASRDLVLAPGARRFRPWLLQRFGAALGLDDADLVDASVAVELIHAASLLHDDVIDQADLRRGRPTASALYGPTLAVLSGDWMLVRALERIQAREGLVAPTLHVISEMTVAIAAEVEGRCRADFALDAWRAMAVGKTGALFGLCGRLAGVLAGDGARAAAFEAAGRQLGLAFQIADDVADLTGAAGKGRYNDLRTGSPSFPVLWAVGRDGDLGAQLALGWAGRGRADWMDRAGATVRALGAVEAASAAADAAIAVARAALGEDAADSSLDTVLGWATALVQLAAGSPR